MDPSTPFKLPPFDPKFQASPPLLSPSLSAGSSHPNISSLFDSEDQNVRIFPLRSVKHIPPNLNRLNSNISSQPSKKEFEDLDSRKDEEEFTGGKPRAGMYYNGSSRADSVKTEENYMTARFEHVADGGNWVITGREGTLTRCEDEPIRSPGAVQSFGVLIAFDWSTDEEEPSLFVQQVSENSGHILGAKFTASKLLRSRTLLEFFDLEEQEVLLESLEALAERDAEEETGKAVEVFTFQLSGAGESEDSEWSAYAAIHRPDRGTLCYSFEDNRS